MYHAITKPFLNKICFPKFKLIFGAAVCYFIIVNLDLSFSQILILLAYMDVVILVTYLREWLYLRMSCSQYTWST